MSVNRVIVVLSNRRLIHDGYIDYSAGKVSGTISNCVGKAVRTNVA